VTKNDKKCIERARLTQRRMT